jgi:hypothetical protein
MFVVAALAGAGCAADPDGTTAQTRGWFAARALDLSDVVAVRVAVGPGLLAHARVTRFVAIGAGELGSVAAGRPSFTLDHYQLGWIKREGGLWTERRVELGLSTMYSFDAEGGDARRRPRDVRSAVAAHVRRRRGRAPRVDRTRGGRAHRRSVGLHRWSVRRRPARRRRVAIDFARRRAAPGVAGAIAHAVTRRRSVLAATLGGALPRALRPSA